MNQDNVQSHSQQMASGTIWSALERFSILGIQLLCTFILARFLTPSDFGLMGMLVVFTLIGNTLTEAGFPQSLIRANEVTPITLSTLFWTNLLISLLVYGLLWMCAPAIATFYHEPQLVQVSRATFLVIPLGGLCAIQIARYQRQLAFRRICLISLCSSLVGSIVAILIAWHTRSVWALVIQTLLTYLLRALLYAFTSHWHPRLQFSMSELRKHFAFSRNLLVSYVLGNLFSNIYTILIGRLYGAAETGFFTQADRIRTVFSTSSTSVVQNVSFPVLTRVNHEGGDLRQAYRRVILTALMAVGFVMVLIVGVGPDLFQLVMGGPEWRASGEYLLPLGIVGILFPLHCVNENILLVKGLSHIVLRLEIFRRCLMVLLILLFLRYRMGIFIWSYALYSFLLLFVNLRICGRPIGYTTRQQLRDIRPILTAFLLTYVTSQVSNHLFALLPLPLRLFLTLLLSASIGLLLLHRLPTFRDAYSTIKGVLKKKI